MRRLLGVMLLASWQVGCSLVASSGDFTFEGDSACVVDSDCMATPNTLAECVDGRCERACVPGFDDCDRLPGNGCEVDLSSDAQNCGACETVCQSAGATTACVDRVCQMAECAPGLADCDGLTENGCEASLETSANCLGCNVACPAERNICEVSPDGSRQCVENCVGDLELCGGDACVDLTTNPNFCGDCETECRGSNAEWGCAAGVCTVTDCVAGFGDCNGDSQDGCEFPVDSDVTNCGACGNVCAGPNASDWTCGGGECQVAACEGGFLDCDMDGANGCESDGLTDPMNCGGCGTVCAGACTNGQCDEVRDVSLNEHGGCAIDSNNQLYCWGDDLEFGLQGRGTSVLSTAAPASLGSTPVSAIGSAQKTNCVGDVGGGVRCWGSRDNGALGDGIDPPSSNPNHALTPTAVAGDTEFNATVMVGIEGGVSTLCAWSADGKAWCWGHNHQGQIPGSAANPSPVSMVADGLTPATSVIDAAIANAHICFAYEDGSVRCSGFNGAHSRLGNAALNTAGSINGTNVIPDGLPLISEVESVGDFSCVLSRDGEVWCWGGPNTKGEMGDGTTTAVPIPKKIAEFDSANNPVSSLAATANGFCALARQGLYCWGNNNHGVVGLPNTLETPDPNANTLSPLRIDNRADQPNLVLSELVSLRSSRRAVCALRRNGQVPVCWGERGRGVIGDGSFIHSTPVPLRTFQRGDVSFQSVGGGGSTVGVNNIHFACGLDTNNFVKCMGHNLGFSTGQQPPNSATNNMGFGYPLSTVDGIEATSLAVGSYFSCVTSDDDLDQKESVFCWGGGTAQALGRTGSSLAPVKVPLPDGHHVKHLAVGNGHACVIYDDLLGTDQVICWGLNNFGQSGQPIPATGPNDPPPSTLPGTVTMPPGCVPKQLALMSLQSYALCDDNTIVSWGLTGAPPNPMPTLQPGTNVKKVFAGFGHKCIIADPTMSGVDKLYCWGNNQFGELGDGTTTSRATPKLVPGSDGVLDVALGTFFSCALYPGGEVRCWGRGTQGQLGNGMLEDSLTPVVAFTNPDIASIASGGGSQGNAQVFAVLNDNSVIAWGANRWGSLGTDLVYTGTAVPMERGDL